MRIVVNDIAASTGGALSILRDFYHYIKENDTENEWIFLLGGSYIEETERIRVILLPEVKNSRVRKLWFDFVSGRKVIAELKPDRVFSLQNIITFGVKVPQTVYIHQPVPFQSVKRFSLWKRSERALAVYQHIIGRIIKLSARKAERVIVQTKWMKKAVAEQAGIPQEKITNVLPGMDDLSAYRGYREFSNTDFFYPTANVLYKNNSCIYRACELLEEKGIRDFKVKLTVDAPATATGENLIFTGRIPREEVLKEYSGSTLIFPSYIETFGYPLAEARQLGTIILASDCAFSREVLEGYENAYFFDPFKPEELAKLMERVIKGKYEWMEENVRICENGSWDKIAEVILCSAHGV